MERLRIAGHEILDPRAGFRAGRAAVAQVFDKARIAGREAAEFGPGHAGLGQEFLDLAYQHGLLSLWLGTDESRISSCYVPYEILLV